MSEQWLLSNVSLGQGCYYILFRLHLSTVQLRNAGYRGEEMPSEGLLISHELQGYKKKSNYFPHWKQWKCKPLP